ncbi:hypothetical protein PVAP13_9NG341800 [Panicum virgatum]|uniref:Uncharacterized protein n=1 Tax=Panicum virgatum TaxID=38727 RepID=A0A8T0MPV5_PANVG|nr:hypothetical protein PVAP13_9NG341800 [Panicum virgatum]
MWRPAPSGGGPRGPFRSRCPSGSHPLPFPISPHQMVLPGRMVAMAVACFHFLRSLFARLGQPALNKLPSRLGMLKAMGKTTSVSTGTAALPFMRTSEIGFGTWITDCDSWMAQSEDGLSLFSNARSPDICGCYTLSENDGSVQELLMENQRLHLEIVRMIQEIRESNAAWLHYYKNYF